jgi:hypothetical protein
VIAFGSRQFAVDDLTEVWLPSREQGEQERHRAERRDDAKAAEL